MAGKVDLLGTSSHHVSAAELATGRLLYEQSFPAECAFRNLIAMQAGRAAAGLQG